jgi:hypothetical protein
MNLTDDNSNWLGRLPGSMSAVEHDFVMFDSPTHGARAGLLNFLLQKATPYEQNREFWDGGGAEAIAEKVGVGLRDNIDLKDQRVGRAFGTAVANMESGFIPRYQNAYQEGFDMVYRDMGQDVPRRRSIE